MHNSLKDMFILTLSQTGPFFLCVCRKTNLKTLRYELFLLSPQYFLPHCMILSFSSNWKFTACKLLRFEVSKICCLGKGWLSHSNHIILEPCSVKRGINASAISIVSGQPMQSVQEDLGRNHSQLVNFLYVNGPLFPQIQSLIRLCGF